MSKISVNVEQLTALIDFLEAHPDLALGRFHRTTEGRCKANRMWAKCAQAVNAVSPNGLTKTAQGWRTYYAEYKSKLLKKVKEAIAHREATGGGEPSPLLLTPLQERLHIVLGPDVGEPLPGVRHNPITPAEHVSPNVSAFSEGDDGASNIEIQEPASMEVLTGSPHSIILQRVVEPVPVIIQTESPLVAAPQTPVRRRRRRRQELQRQPRATAERSALDEALNEMRVGDNAQAVALHRLAAAMERIATVMEAKEKSLRNQRTVLVDDLEGE